MRIRAASPLDIEMARATLDMVQANETFSRLEKTPPSGSEATAASRNEGRPPASMKGAPPAAYAPSPEGSHVWLSSGPETSFGGC
ncbi:hypothetical protein ACLB2K_003242 [Fragaria x ananassa]